MAISNTEVGGVYVFSGDASGSPPYQVDPSSPTGVDQLITPQQSTLQIAGPSGVTFQVSMTAQDLFDQQDSGGNPTANNAFAALNGLVQALQSGDTANITQAVGALQTASSYVNNQTGFYGAAENNVSSALDLAQKFQTQDQTQLSGLEDANTATLAVEVTQDLHRPGCRHVGPGSQAHHHPVRLSADQLAATLPSGDSQKERNQRARAMARSPRFRALPSRALASTPVRRLISRILRANRKKMFNSCREMAIEDRTQAGGQQQRGYRSRTQDFGKDSVHV